MDRPQRMTKKIYRSCNTDRRVITNHNERKDSRQESERKTEANDVAMAKDYAMKTNYKLHVAREQRKWKAMSTYAHDGHGT